MLFKITPNFKCTNLLLCHSFDECILHFRITVLFSVLVIYVGRDSADGILTRYELDGPGIEFRWGARFSAPVQSGPGAHPAYYTMGTGSFPGVKRPGRGVDHPPPYSAEIKERVELHLYSTSGPSCPVIGWTLPSPYLPFDVRNCGGISK